MFWSWLLQWLGILLEYIIAGLLVAAGGYLEFYLGANRAAPFTGILRFVGRTLMVGGLAIGLITYGKSIGAVNCEARWKAANYQAQVDHAKEEASGHQLAAQIAAQHAQELEAQNADQQKQIEDYRSSTDKLSATVAACRLSTANDDRVLCNITGRSAPGCKPAR